jgi:hypothetical protein
MPLGLPALPRVGHNIDWCISKQGWPSLVLVFSPHISKDYFHLHEYIVCDIVELTEGEDDNDVLVSIIDRFRSRTSKTM